MLRFNVSKRLGGGFRQAGYMAAAGTIALQTMQKQIAEDNRKADFLAAKSFPSFHDYT